MPLPDWSLSWSADRPCSPLLAWPVTPWPGLLLWLPGSVSPSTGLSHLLTCNNIWNIFSYQESRRIFEFSRGTSLTPSPLDLRMGRFQTVIWVFQGDPPTPPQDLRMGRFQHIKIKCELCLLHLQCLMFFIQIHRASSLLMEAVSIL